MNLTCFNLDYRELSGFISGFIHFHAGSFISTRSISQTHPHSVHYHLYSLHSFIQQPSVYMIAPHGAPAPPPTQSVTLAWWRHTHVVCSAGEFRDDGDEGSELERDAVKLASARNMTNLFLLEVYLLLSNCTGFGWILSFSLRITSFPWWVRRLYSFIGVFWQRPPFWVPPSIS